MSPTGSPPESAGPELREVLDAELSRLPEKYRAPLVLCDLEGRTHEEAARQLGWPAGSMSARLARGRELLRARLGRHGLAFDLRHCSRFLAQHELPRVVLPPGLVTATVRTALAFARGGAGAPAGVSEAAAELTEEVLHSLARDRLRRFALVLVAALAGLGAGLLAYAVCKG
jgi:hypothetical protein